LGTQVYQEILSFSFIQHIQQNLLNELPLNISQTIFRYVCVSGKFVYLECPKDSLHDVKKES